MSILFNKDSRVIVQGITGAEGSFHTTRMIESGATVVGGVTPGKGGQTASGVPVFDTVAQAVAATGADVSCIFVPPAGAADAIMEAAEAKVPLVVAITELIPVLDMARAMAYLKEHPARVIRLGVPGVFAPTGSAQFLLEYFGLTANGIHAAAMKLIERD